MASLKLKGGFGKHLTTVSLYGYVKDADNSGQRIVDDEAAQMVRQSIIAEMASCATESGTT